MPKNKTPVCPRCGKEPAIVDITFGILPGKLCQKEDSKFVLPDSPEFYNISKQHRIQEQRDTHDGDVIQPWLPGKDQKPNPDFVKAYPKDARKYFSKKELKGL